jgi:hypothetical protein
MRVMMRTIGALYECDSCRPGTRDDANRKKAEAIAERPAAPIGTELCRALAGMLSTGCGLPKVAAVSNPRYVLRSAVFVTVYLVVFVFAALIPVLSLTALVAGAVWLTAQAGFGLRRFDVIMLATASMVGATLHGAGLMMSAAVAVWAVLPALLFAVLLDRWLPGYWLGHGDRFRRPSVAFLRLAGAATLTAVSGAVLWTVIDTGFDPGAAVLLAVRDTALLLLAPLAVNTVRRWRSPRRAGFTVVR